MKMVFFSVAAAAVVAVAVFAPLPTNGDGTGVGGLSFRNLAARPLVMYWKDTNNRKDPYKFQVGCSVLAPEAVGCGLWAWAWA